MIMFQLTLAFYSSCNYLWHWKKQHFFWETLIFSNKCNNWKDGLRLKKSSTSSFCTVIKLVFLNLHLIFRLLISSNKFAKKSLDEANGFECCVSWIRCMQLQQLALWSKNILLRKVYAFRRFSLKFRLVIFYFLHN